MKGAKSQSAHSIRKHPWRGGGRVYVLYLMLSSCHVATNENKGIQDGRKKSSDIFRSAFHSSCKLHTRN